jgi:rhodanese-related sulfurtransferase
MEPRTLFARREDLVVLDVREPEEWVAGRVDGAVHIPLGQLPARIGELDRSRPIAVVCRSGNRSTLAADYLAARGFDAVSVDGGLARWLRDGLPVITPDGRPGRVA